jgi:Aldo/keto reductase family
VSRHLFNSTTGKTVCRQSGHGVNWTDTAAVYGLGHTEEVVGRLLRERTPSERPMALTKCASLRRERSLASRVLASCFVLPVHAPSLTGANKIALSLRANPHARPTAPLKTIHGLDGRQREIRRLAYLMTMMTTDQMIGKARGHWPWFAGIVVLAAAAAAGLSPGLPPRRSRRGTSLSICPRRVPCWPGTQSRYGARLMAS